MAKMGVIVSINPTYGGFMYAETPKFGGLCQQKTTEKRRGEESIE